MPLFQSRRSHRHSQSSLSLIIRNESMLAPNRQDYRKRIRSLTRLLRLGYRRWCLSANTALGRLQRLLRLGRGGSAGGRGSRAGARSLRLGLTSTEHLLQSCGLVGRTTVLLLLKLGQTKSLVMDVGDLLLALGV